MRKRKHRRQRVYRPRWIAPLSDAACQRLGRTQPAFCSVQQNENAVGRDRPAREIGGQLLATDGWKVKREKSIFGHNGVALWCFSGNPLGNEFLPNDNDSHHVHHHILPPRQINQASDMIKTIIYIAIRPSIQHPHCH